MGNVVKVPVMSQEIKVTFEPSGRTVYVLPGTILLEAAARAGYIVETPCGGAGRCGKCLIRIVSGHCDVCSEVLGLIEPEQIRRGYRLACRCKVFSPLVVEVPESSLFQTAQKILVQSESDTAMTVDPRREDGAAYGVAFDLGTTTLVGTLMDLRSGRDLALASAINPQTSFGDDVITRIKKCRDESDGLRELQDLIINAVNRLLDELVAKAAVDCSGLRALVFAGNTAMQQIFFGVDPSGLGELPFAAAFQDSQCRTSEELGLHAPPHSPVYVLPQIGGFVGGDTVAGVIATRLDQSRAPTLLVDVGTNGEIVLSHDGRLTATSVAAGPAFEGARIVNGMRATRGAIEKVVMDTDVQINVIGDARPAGICGTGLIDAAAFLLNLGILDETGRMRGLEELPAGLSRGIRNRVLETDGRFNFVLAWGKESATGTDILLYQRDIRELQLANAAIRAGISILLKSEGLDPSDLDVVLLAGAFGNFIRRRHAVRIGMLPAIPHERIRFVGNTASFGAKRFLLSTAEREYAARVTRQTRRLDLSLHPGFQDEFSDAMIFPGADDTAPSF